ncbi:MAG: hypothetical protein JNM89_03015 [Hyphomicrobiaceae bacterium]|nr:hypothetical protein [Hyphomicrobiaceae bacterium]
MMRKILQSSAYSRRIQTSRREIAIAISLTLAALVLTVAALWRGAGPAEEQPAQRPAASQNS